MKNSRLVPGIMGKSALIAQNGWKLVEIDKDKDQFQLYNIAEDNEERFDVSAKHPEIVESLKESLFKELHSQRQDI